MASSRYRGKEVKMMRKFISFFCAAVMAVSVGCTALAAPSPSTVIDVAKMTELNAEAAPEGYTFKAETKTVESLPATVAAETKTALAAFMSTTDTAAGDTVALVKALTGSEDVKIVVANDTGKTIDLSAGESIWVASEEVGLITFSFVKDSAAVKVDGEDVKIIFPTTFENLEVAEDEQIVAILVDPVESAVYPVVCEYDEETGQLAFEWPEDVDLETELSPVDIQIVPDSAIVDTETEATEVETETETTATAQ
jgi:hypothetical protein